MSIIKGDAKQRKGLPIATGVIDYFPRAFAAIAEVSRIGNDQHNPGQPLHWSKEKSYDHANTAVRHLIDRGTLDSDGARHSAKAAWRVLANLEIEIQAEEGDAEAIRQVMENGTAAQKERLEAIISNRRLTPEAQ